MLFTLWMESGRQTHSNVANRWKIEASGFNSEAQLNVSSIGRDGFAKTSQIVCDCVRGGVLTRGIKRVVGCEGWE